MQDNQKIPDYVTLYGQTVPIMGKLDSLSENSEDKLLREVNRLIKYVSTFCEDVILDKDIVPNTGDEDTISYQSFFELTINTLDTVIELTENAEDEAAQEINSISKDAVNAFSMFLQMGDISSYKAYLGLAMILAPLSIETGSSVQRTKEKIAP